MKKTQFIVNTAGDKNRKAFYEYIVNTYKLNICYPFIEEKFVKSNFPFVIDFKEKSFWICDSITCCACAAQAKAIYTVEEFKIMTENNFEKCKKNE